MRRACATCAALLVIALTPLANAQVLGSTPREESSAPPEDAKPVENPATGEEGEAIAPAPAPIVEQVPPKQTPAAKDEMTAEAEDDDPFHRRDPKPKTGMGTLIPGWVLVGFGALNLATSPLCRTDAVREGDQDLCFNLSIGVGIAGVAIGVPLLIVGYNQRATFNEWKQRHRYGWLLNTQVAVTQGGAGLLYNGTF